ncbi:MAG: transglycosylase SLT domain-containing protein [Deltaproteobacteria bacterium]
MKMTAYLLFFTALIFTLSCRDARADFYSYTDEQGVVHLTNVPSSYDKYKWVMAERMAIVKPPGMSNKEFDNIIFDASAKYGVDHRLVKAIVKAESDFRPAARSVKGARGLMQLMPETARRMGVKDILEPQDNVEGGVKYLSMLLRMFDGQESLAVAAYNAGENAVLKYGAIPPYSETQTYVKRVLKYYAGYKSSN